MESASDTVVDLAGAPLLAAIGDAIDDVFLSSPYISRGVAILLANHARASTAHWRLLTNLNPVAVAGGYLSLDGLRELLEGGVAVRHLPHLHAKAQVADSFGLIGSANLTNAGLALGTRHNAELSVLLSPHEVVAARATLALWWETSQIVDEHLLNTVEALAASLPTASADTHDGVPTIPALQVEQLLAEARDPNKTLWIKAQSGAPRPDQWRNPYWFSNPGPGKPSLKAGDLALIYAKDIHGCYAVVEITDTATFDPDYVTENSGGDPEIGKRWPWVTRTRPQFVPVELTTVTASEIGISPYALQGGRKMLTLNEFACAVRGLHPNA